MSALAYSICVAPSNADRNDHIRRQGKQHLEVDFVDEVGMDHVRKGLDIVVVVVLSNRMDHDCRARVLAVAEHRGP